MGHKQVWNIPYSRNPFFTGRTDLLTQLAATLHAGQPTALSQPQAISGLGGIGKTQIAIEYAYQHEQDYHAVLWAQADTRENLTSSFLALATVLNLPERDASESAQVVAAVKHWLQMTPGYVLILDNADDLALAREFLPVKQRGQVMLTTRAQGTGRFARRLEVGEFPTKQGVLFLLRRSGLIAPDAPIEQAKEADQVIAKRLCEELGGLPLALDQAGAYMEETGCGLARYEQRYQQERGKVLAERRSGLVNDHPLPVAATWKLSFEQVEQASPIAAELLQACAFLAPDAIPEELLEEVLKTSLPSLKMSGQQRRQKGRFPKLITGQRKKPALVLPSVSDGQMDEVVAILRAYSLIQRNAAEKTLSVHRLVQAVLKDTLSVRTRRRWQAQIVQAINTVFPERVVDELSGGGRLFLHTLVCVSWVEDVARPTKAAIHLLNRAGESLTVRGQYEKAELLLQRALSIREQQLGPLHSDVADSLNSVANLYMDQGKYEQAEPLLQRALSIREQQLGPLHLDAAHSLNDLALLYQRQGKYEQAEPLYQRSYAIYEQLLGFLHPDTATSLDNLAGLYQNQEKYEQAELLHQRVLSIREQQLGPLHLDTAHSLNNLATLYYQQGRYEQAEPLYQRALTIHEQQLGPLHPDTATSLNNLANAYRNQGKYEQAEPLYQRALSIREQQLGPLHPDTATNLHSLATLYQKLEKYKQAEPLYQRALTIREQRLGPLHPRTTMSLDSLALLYYQQGKYEQAEPLYQMLAIREQQVGAEHPDTAQSLNNLATLYQTQGKYAEAEPLYQQALEIYQRILGSDHPTTQATQTSYISLLEAMEQNDAFSS